MKITFLRCYNSILSALLLALGFESCDSISSGEDEYGCPITKYQLKGKVTDESGIPIKDLKVSQKHIVENGVYGIDSTATDAKGEYQFKESSEVEIPSDIKLVIEDVDGVENGEFLSDTVGISQLPRNKVEEGNGWYRGKYEIDGSRKLKKK